MNPDGQVVFRYTDCLTVGGITRIADCTAINVAEDGSVWVYYYTDFPLVNLRDPKQVRAWGELPVEFAEAFCRRKSESALRRRLRESKVAPSP